MHENPGRTKKAGRPTIIRVDTQIYTNVRKKNRLRLVERGAGNITGPKIQSSSDVRHRPNTYGVESNDVSEPAG